MDQKSVVLGESFTLGQSLLESEPFYWAIVGLWLLLGLGLVAWGVKLYRKKKLK